MNKAPPFGNDLLEGVMKFPRYSLRIVVVSSTQGRVVVEQINEKFESEFKRNNRVSVIIGDASNRLLYFNENL